MTVRKPKVLVVGGGITLGYHILDQLKDKFEFTATYTPMGANWDTTQPWTRVAIDFLNPQVLKACLSGLLTPGGYDCVVLSPEVNSDKRTMVANCFLDALQTSSYNGSVIMLSHDGANESASSEGRIQLAELYTIENKIQGMTCLKRVYILRVAMLQEQLFYAAAHSIRSSLVLPVDLHFLNPITTLDVVLAIQALIEGTSTAFAKRTRSVSHLTGPGTCVRHCHLDVITHGAPTQFCSDPDGSYGKRYWEWSRRVRYSIPLPYWPTGGEIATEREYFGYVGRSLEPAKTSSDWDEICPGEQRQSLAYLLDVIHDHLGLLGT